MTTVHERFAALQERFAAMLSATEASDGPMRAVVVLPSHSVAESMLSHYASRIAPLEHRYLVIMLLLRIPARRLAFLTCSQPDPEVVEHYLSLLPPTIAHDARDRFRIFVVEDPSPRALAAKVLERPDILRDLRTWIGTDPAFLQPWNVTALERDLALQLGIPVNGAAPELWPLGFKSAGRRLFRDVGVPVPAGVEDLHTVHDAVEAIEQLRRVDPGIGAVVLKHDDSGAGDGNAVLDLSDLEAPGSKLPARRLQSRIQRLPAWYLQDLHHGFVVEERITAERIASPSAQVHISPMGEVTVLSTHDQRLGGANGHVYMGCSFPADTAYAGAIGRHAHVIGAALASKGVIGKVGVDFIVGADGEAPWVPYALEINLRNGGTTHPFTVLRNLVPGDYDVAAGTFAEPGGQPKHYESTDNLVDEAWTGLPPASVLTGLGDAGLTFHRESKTGVVPHMLNCLAIDGRIGVTAIGDSPTEALERVDAVRRTLDALAHRWPRPVSAQG